MSFHAYLHPHMHVLALNLPVPACRPEPACGAVLPAACRLQHSCSHLSAKVKQCLVRISSRYYQTSAWLRAVLISLAQEQTGL